MQHALLRTVADSALPVVERRVAIADVDGAVHELAPLSLFSRIGELSAERLEHGSEVDCEADTVLRVFPVVDAVRLYVFGYA